MSTDRDRSRRITELHAEVVRHATQCSICGVAISPKHPQGHPHKAVAGHIIPRAMGGTEDRWNLRPECATCSNTRAHETTLTHDDNRSRDWTSTRA